MPLALAAPVPAPMQMDAATNTDKAMVMAPMPMPMEVAIDGGGGGVAAAAAVGHHDFESQGLRARRQSKRLKITVPGACMIECGLACMRRRLRARSKQRWIEPPACSPCGHPSQPFVTMHA